jgi:hypothetical protein
MIVAGAHRDICPNLPALVGAANEAEVYAANTSNIFDAFSGHPLPEMPTLVAARGEKFDREVIIVLGQRTWAGRVISERLPQRRGSVVPATGTVLVGEGADDCKVRLRSGRSCWHEDAVRSVVRLVAAVLLAGNLLAPLAWTPWDDTPLQAGVEIDLNT